VNNAIALFVSLLLLRVSTRLVALGLELGCSGFGLGELLLCGH
jgi:hypothetical protein